MHEGVFLAHKVWGGRYLKREEIESFLKEARTARFCSHNSDETIHAYMHLESTAIWLCEKYMSKEKAKDQWRIAAPPATNWLKITVKPERMASFDYG